MNTPKNRLMKTILTAPLALTLLLGATACSPNTNEEGEPAVSQPFVETQTLSPSVKKNMEKTFGEFIKLSQNEDFVGAVMEAGSTGEKIQGFEEEVKTLYSLVENNDATELVKKEAQETFLADDIELDPTNLELLAKSTPLFVIANSYSRDYGADGKVVIDPNGFNHKDGSWIQVKDGSIGFQNKDNAYYAYTLASDTLAFNDDGTKLALNSLAGYFKELDKMETPAYNEMVALVKHFDKWYADKKKASTITGKEKISDLGNRIIKDFKRTTDAKISFEDSEGNMVIVSTLNDEKISYNSMEDFFDSNKAPTNDDPAKTSNLSYFVEYIDVYNESGEESGKYFTLDKTVETLNSKNNGISWSVEKKNSESYVVAKKDKSQYKFIDVTQPNEEVQPKQDGESDLKKLLDPSLQEMPIVD